VYQKFTTPTLVQNCVLIQNLPFRVCNPNRIEGNDEEGNRILYMNVEEEANYPEYCSPTLIYNINRHSLVLRFHTIYENVTEHYAFHGPTYGLQYNITLNVPTPVVTNGPVPVRNTDRFLPGLWKEIENKLSAMNVHLPEIEAIATIIHNQGIIIPDVEKILDESLFEFQISKTRKDQKQNKSKNSNKNEDDEWQPTNMED
jgi:hypothetical protein